MHKKKTVRGQKEIDQRSSEYVIKICPRGEMNDTSLTKPSYPQRHADILSLNMSVDMERSCFNQGKETCMKNSRNYDKGE